jgi:hypothetical protein
VLRELVAILAIAAGLSVTGDARAEDPLVFVGDPKMGVESTVRSTDSVARLFYRYEGVLPDTGIDESRFPGNVLGVLGRAVKLILVDEPLAELTSEISHEVGGHGGRARELGLDPTFLFYLPIVYRKVFAPSDEARAGAFTQFLTRNAVEGDRAMLGTLGGLEANYVHAWWINARIVRARGRVHHGDLLVYLASKLPYADSVYSVPPEGDGGNDIASYVTHLQDRFNRWRPDDRRAISRRLGAGYVWNLVDPTLFYAVYGTLVANVGQGRPVTKMPLPRIGDTTVLLSPRFALSPFGAEQTLDLFLGQGSGMLDLYGRVVSSGLADAYGVGARVLGIRAGDRTTLGAEIDLWRQPELLLDARGVFDRPQRLGLNAGAFFDVRVASIFGITGKIASKTPGWVVGQPASGGLHGYLGVSLALP